MSLPRRICSFALLCGIAAVTCGAVTETNRPRVGGRVLSGTYASIHPGKVRVVKNSSGFELADEVDFKKLGSSDIDYWDAIKSKAGVSEITIVGVPDTFFSFVLFNGAVQPIIVDVEKHQAWVIEGLGKYFSRCRSIAPGPKRMAFGHVEGVADIWPVWSFDFSDKERGPTVTFDVTGGW